MKTEARFEAYEDNAGNITVFILEHDNKTAIAAYGNWECTTGSLADGISDLAEDPKAYLSWGGNYGGDIEVPERYDRNGKAVGAMTVADVHNEIAGDKCTTLFAWTTDDGLVVVDFSGCGYAAHKVLGAISSLGDALDKEDFEDAVRTFLEDSEYADLSLIGEPEFDLEHKQWTQAAEDSKCVYSLALYENTEIRICYGGAK